MRDRIGTWVAEMTLKRVGTVLGILASIGTLLWLIVGPLVELKAEQSRQKSQIEQIQTIGSQGLLNHERLDRDRFDDFKQALDKWQMDMAETVASSTAETNTRLNDLISEVRTLRIELREYQARQR